MNENTTGPNTRISIGLDGKLVAAPEPIRTKHIPLRFSSPAPNGRLFTICSVEQNGFYNGWHLAIDNSPLERGEAALITKEVIAWIEDCIANIRHAVGDEEFSRVNQRKETASSYDWIKERFQN